MTDESSELRQEEALSRRERDQKRRENGILGAALRLILDEGFSTFSMDRLAEATGYSRAALYNYFPCKEEVVIALAIEAAKRRVELGRLVSMFDARPRERFVAINEACVILYPEFFNMEMVAYAGAFRDRTSRERQLELAQLDMMLYENAIEIVNDAVECGDLELPPSMAPGELVFTLWIVVVGMFGAKITAEPLERLGIHDLVASLRRTGRILMDGFGWRPLSGEWDYRETMRRIYSELFTPVVIDRIKRF
jgi:AcrR family transcriptional regulator